MLGAALSARPGAEDAVMGYLWCMLRNDAFYGAAILCKKQRLERRNYASASGATTGVGGGAPSGAMAGEGIARGGSLQQQQQQQWGGMETPGGYPPQMQGLLLQPPGTIQLSPTSAAQQLQQQQAQYLQQMQQQQQQVLPLQQQLQQLVQQQPPDPAVLPPLPPGPLPRPQLPSSSLSPMTRSNSNPKLQLPPLRSREGSPVPSTRNGSGSGGITKSQLSGLPPSVVIPPAAGGAGVQQVVHDVWV